MGFFVECVRQDVYKTPDGGFDNFILAMRKLTLDNIDFCEKTILSNSLVGLLENPLAWNEG